MLAAARSTSCHGGGKPTGYISLMDKKGGKREKKNVQWGARARVALANGTAKTAETLISPRGGGEKKPKNRVAQNSPAGCFPPETNSMIR